MIASFIIPLIRAGTLKKELYCQKYVNPFVLFRNSFTTATHLHLANRTDFVNQDFLQSDYRSFSVGLFFLVFPLSRICQQVWTDCSREGLYSVSHNKSSPLTLAAGIRSCSPGLTEMRLVMCNLILWQQVGSDQGSRASVTKPPALERRGGRVHTSYCF